MRDVLWVIAFAGCACAVSGLAWDAIRATAWWRRRRGDRAHRAPGSGAGAAEVRPDPPGADPAGGERR